MKKYFVVIFLMLLGQIGGTLTVAAATLSEGQVLINEILPGTKDSASQEFIELYNTTDGDINLTGWKLQYASASGSTWKTLSSLSFNVDFISASGYYLLSSSAYNLTGSDGSFAASMAQAAGQLRLIDEDNLLQDQVSWGVSATMAQGSPAAPASAGQSLARLVTNDEPQNTNNNIADFTVAAQPSPGVANQPEAASDEDSNSNPQSVSELSSQPADSQVNYLPLLITELLPDPASPQTDANDEFVELYNPNPETVDMTGYTIFTGNNDNYKYKIPEGLIAPGEYTAFYSKDTNLTLTNSGGRAKLLAPNGSQIDLTQSYSSVPVGQAWIRDGDNWQWSNNPTPGEANQLATVPQSNNSTQPGNTNTAETTYQIIEISELLPNPAAPQTDDKDEYVELFNPNNSVVDLSGYSIVTGNSGNYRYVIDNVSIQPGVYVVFYSRDTNLTLSNSAGIAKLLAPDGTVIYQTDSYGQADAGQAWISTNGKWQWTTSPTPGAANQLSALAAKVASTKPAATKKASTAKKASATTSKKPVKGSTTGSANNTPVKANSAGILPPLVLAGIGLLVLVYALYEYRDDLANRYHQFRRNRAARAAAGQSNSAAASGGVSFRFRGWQNHLRSWLGTRLW